MSDTWIILTLAAIVLVALVVTYAGVEMIAPSPDFVRLQQFPE